jgi:FAD/FMN-containing dehydrogenase
MGSLLTPHPLVVDLLKQQNLTVLTPSSPEWAETRATYIIDNPAKPVAIARPRNAEEVSIFVKAARSHGVKISVRVGGHDVAARSVADGCLVIDLREIKSIEISEDKQTATIGGGILIGDVIKTLTPQRLVTPFGYFPTIGYAGWAMMGGYGWLASRFGLGVDQIKRARVVTAQGDIIEADAELLKGIRGAGGNFGVVVELGIRIYPLEKVRAPQFHAVTQSDRHEASSRDYSVSDI